MNGKRETPYLRLWHRIGMDAPTLRLRRVQLAAFTEADWREIRDEFGATELMIEELRRLAADANDDRDVAIDFETERVGAV